MKATTADPLDGLRAFIADVARGVVRDELAHARPANDDLLSSREAAKIARVTASTLRRWVRERLLARYGTGPRILIKRADLERFLSGAAEVASPEDRARRRFG